MVDFAGFVAPLDAREFQTDYYGKRPVHIRREGLPSQSLLSWSRLNDVLAITPYWTEDSLKIYYKSRAALRENYCDTSEARAGQKALVNPTKVKALIGLGASLVANHVHRICPEVAAVTQMLEQQFAARTFANAYCSFRDVQAFQTHYDLHDVFALQTEGEKVWRVYEARAESPVTPVPPGDEAERWLTNSRGALLFEAHMKPGDVLYLPRGQYHDALTGAQASLHVTFGVQPATGLALFKLLESALTKENAFRAYLPDARSETELHQRLAELADRVSAVVTSPAFAIDVLNHQRGLAGAAADYDLPAQHAPTWYAVARQVPVERQDAGFSVAIDGHEIALGATYPAVEWALQQRFFSLEDAIARHPGVDRAELRHVVDDLARIGAVVATVMQQ